MISSRTRSSGSDRQATGTPRPAHGPWLAQGQRLIVSSVLGWALGALGLGALGLGADAARAGELDWSGSIELELRSFLSDPAFPDQLRGGQGSVVLAPELGFKTEDRRHQFRLVPYLRLDGRDDERSHFDLRQAYWRYVGDGWEILAGLERVFWGVAESRHLVDIINQTDSVEDVDEEDKLGQPMIALSTSRSWGTLALYVMPVFRERTFSGRDGRLRTPLVVDTDDAQYESSAEDSRVDLALRWSHFLGDWDVGVSYFYGTGREPRLVPAATGDRLLPFYDVIQQIGVDVQYTRGAWLWKLEALAREGQGRTFGAAVAGFEYTLYQVKAAADLGLLAEYLWDDRDDFAPPTAFEDDLFLGARLALNDTQDTTVLAGGVVDLDERSWAVLIEAERRLTDHFTIEVESRLFLDVSEEDLLAAFAADDFAVVRLAYHF